MFVFVCASILFFRAIDALPWIQSNIDFPYYPSHLKNPQAPLGVYLNSTKELGLAVNETPNLQPWYRLLQDLQSGKKKVLNIVMLGGSMTYGHVGYIDPKNMNNPLNICNAKRAKWGNECAYPVYFEELLKQAYPTVNVKVHNLAVRGCNSQCILNARARAMHALGPIDMVMIHMTTNDQYQARPEDFPLVAAAFEAIIRFAQRLPSKPIVTILEMLPMKHINAKIDLYLPHYNVTRYYQIPVITVDQYANHQEYPGSKWWPLWEMYKVHPEWVYHKALANFLYSVWVAHDERASKSILDKPDIPLPPLKYEQQFNAQVCYQCREDLDPSNWQKRYIEKGGWIDGDDQRKKWEDNVNKYWVAGEDPRGKPGLWVDNVDGATLMFKISIRKSLPLIGITYLQSYTKMGTIEAFIEGDEQNVVEVNALSTYRNVSVKIYSALCLEVAQGPTMLPLCEHGKSIEYRDMNKDLFVMRTLVLRLRPVSKKLKKSVTHNKFKLLSVVSC